MRWAAYASSSLDQEKVCPCFFSAVPDQWRWECLGVGCFEVDFFTLLSGSHALLVYGLTEHIFSFLVAKLPQRKIHSVNGFLERRLYDWIQFACLLAAVGNATKKKRWQRTCMWFHQCTLAAGLEPGTQKGENLSDVTPLAQGFFVWMSLRSHGGRMPVDHGVRCRETRTADKMRTDRHTVLLYR